MLDKVICGAQVSMTPKEADGFAGDGPMRLVTCANGQVIGGFGSVGLLEHTGDTDLQEFMDQVVVLRAGLKALAAGQQPTKPRATFTFIRI